MAGGPGDGGVIRMRSLDSLRGLAAVAVMLYHFTFIFDEAVAPGSQKSVYAFALGRYGVNLFFMISGFVILWSIQRVDRVGQFAYSRFTRLFPPFWASIFIVTAFILLGRHVYGTSMEILQFTVPQWFANFTMVPRWFPGVNWQPLDGAYWTLALEMGFYVTIGVMMALGLTRRRRIVPTMAVLWSIDVFLNVVNFLHRMSLGDHVPGQVDYTPLFIVGMSLFLLYQEKDRPRRDRQILWLMVVVTPFLELLRFNVTSAVVTMGLVAVMYFAIFRTIPGLTARPLQFLGGISYSLYLVHCYPGYVTMKLLMDHGWNRNLAVLAAIAQSLVLAIILNRTVEKPVTRWLRQRRSNVKPVPQIATS
jgi:peptidoglycan/LPS O-acetylase OafA/YrhL